MKHELEFRAPPVSSPAPPGDGGPADHGPAVDEVALRAGLARIERHPTLAASPRLRRLLRYLFEETLAGRGSEISQFSIAFDCYQLGKGFDPSASSLIRSHARRLRKLLQELARPEDAAAIRLGERGYRLSFGAPESTGEALPHGSPPALGIVEFETRLTATNAVPPPAVLVDALLRSMRGEDLLNGVGSFKPATSRSCARQARELARREQLDFILEGRLEEERGQLVVGVHLREGKSGCQIWTTRSPLRTGDPCGEGLAEWAGSIVSQIGSAWGIIPGHIGAAALAGKSGKLGTYEAVVLARQYLTHFDFEPLGRIVETLRTAACDSQDAAVPATLAVLLNTVGSTEPRWNENPDKSEIRRLASRAARLDPGNPWTRLALACSALLDGRRAELLEMGRRVEREQETPPMLAGALGTLLCYQALDLELARGLIARYRRQSAAYPRLVHLALAVAHLSEGNTPGARAELANFGVPWGWASPLIHAVCAALEGDAAEARREWQRVLDAFPEFPARWRDTVATQWHESHLKAIFQALERAGIRVG